MLFFPDSFIKMFKRFSVYGYGGHFHLRHQLSNILIARRTKIVCYWITLGPEQEEMRLRELMFS